MGRDIICKKDRTKYVVECKRYSGCCRRPIIQKVHSAAMMSNAIGIVMTSGYFSKEAIGYAAKAGIILIDGRTLSKFYKNVNTKKLKKFA